MTKRTIFSLALLLGFIGFYLYWNDFFRAPRIQVTASIRPGRLSSLNPDAYPVTFMLDGKYKLTSIKVVSVADAKTNKYPHPLWHMISDSASEPTKIITYGSKDNLRGMKPSVPKGRPEPLQPNVPYRIYVEAGKAIGTNDFMTKEVAQPN
jgi:hypothetical protein